MRRLVLLVSVWFTAAALYANDLVGRDTTEGRERVQTDAFSYLEDGANARTRAWVRAQNERSIATLEADPRYRRFYGLARAAADADGSLREFSLVQGAWVYQLHATAAHPRGVLRRTRYESQFGGAERWEELLDVDELAAREDRNLVLVLGATTASPSGHRALVALSDGGWSVTEAREFDLERRTFVDDGFRVPRSLLLKTAWKDENTVIVAADFGPGSLNEKGMPIVVKEWRRGQPLDQAREIFRGDPTDVAVGVLPQTDSHGRPVLIVFRRTVQNVHMWWQLEDDGTLTTIKVPPKTGFVRRHRDQYLFQLPENWSTGHETWKADSVLAIPVAELSRDEPRVRLVVSPEQETTIFNWLPTRSGLLVYEFCRGTGRLIHVRYEGGKWLRTDIVMPEFGSIRHAASSPNSNNALVIFESFLRPDALYAVDTERGSARLIRGDPDAFDAARFVTQQWEARSIDGTMVPYFITRPRDMKYERSSPVLMYGYGAFGGSQVPHYDRMLGKLWLEPGGVYVVANVRGGRERGAEWHVRRAERRFTYADMIAIAEDLVKRGVTAPKRIGISGQSAGGLLAGAVITQRPDLFGAAVLRVGVLDQLRTDLNGVPVAHDVNEWGSLEVPEERAFLQRTSPFQNLRPRADFPVPFIITSATDERVPPAQSRRFAAKMESFGMPFFYYESAEGSHAVTTSPDGKARLDAQIFTYLSRQLIDAAPTH